MALETALTRLELGLACANGGALRELWGNQIAEPRWHFGQQCAKSTISASPTTALRLWATSHMVRANVMVRRFALLLGRL